MQEEEHESEAFCTTWTEDFNEHLKSIVETHALAEDDSDEMHKSNQKNIDDITVEVCINYFLKI